MWEAFLRKNGLPDESLREVAARIRRGLEWIWKT